MTFDEVKDSERRNVVVGIGFDGHAKELLDWALVKVAEPGDRVIAIHVSRSSDLASKDKTLLEDYEDDYEGLCNKKQVDLAVHVLKGNSIRKVLVREAKNHFAIALIVGTSKHSALGGWTSVAKYCSKKLPFSTDVMAVHNGKVVFRRGSNVQRAVGDPRPSLSLEGNFNFKDCQSEFGDSDVSEVGRLSHEVISSPREEWKDCSSGSLNDEPLRPYRKHKTSSLSLRSISIPIEDFTSQRPGWPLLQTSSSLTKPSLEARKMSVVRWVLSLPDRSSPESPQSKSDSNESNTVLGRGTPEMSSTDDLSISNESPINLELSVKADPFEPKWFSLDDLSMSTSQFSADNLIGKGGCNHVYKGLLQDGRPVAVKILKSSKESWNNFALELEIMATLRHKNITPLLGICVETTNLVSVYNFYSKGNLEENLHGSRKEKSKLSWGVRFRIALGIAEALHYLHAECPRPVIHRDIKSSNILLTDGFEPQLSDFGLAIWAPTTTSFLTHSDVVGTFGYLAPEYFMFGKVSDKIDVYSFGVVLLELLSGRKAIGHETPKGQESLVMWGKPKLDSGDAKSILDDNLRANVDEVQMRRMSLAARLCLTQSSRLRPRMSQILSILNGDVDVDELITNLVSHSDSAEKDVNDDEVYPESSTDSHLGIALLDVNDNSTSFSSQEQTSPLSVEEYLKKRWSRSSSLD